MPRRRRKYRPLHPDKEKPTPFFARSRRESPAGTILQSTEEQAAKYQEVKAAKSEAVNVVKAVTDAIQESQPDQALVNQSRALEWFNRMWESDVDDIAVIQQAVRQIGETVVASTFSCGPSVHRTYGQVGRTIDLGFSFKQLDFGEQVYALIKAAVGRTSLPERYQLPASRFEHVDPAATWADYLCTLLQLLPDHPYLITGTPISTSTLLDQTGETGDDDDDDETGDAGDIPFEAPTNLSINRSFGRPDAAVASQDTEENDEPEAKDPADLPAPLMGNQPDPTKETGIMDRLKRWFSRKNN